MNTRLSGRERVSRVAEAIGMLSVQADCTPDEAFALMRACAHVGAKSVEEVAAAVVARNHRSGE